MLLLDRFIRQDTLREPLSEHGVRHVGCRLDYVSSRDLHFERVTRRDCLLENRLLFLLLVIFLLLGSLMTLQRHLEVERFLVRADIL